MKCENPPPQAQHSIKMKCGFQMKCALVPYIILLKYAPAPYIILLYILYYYYILYCYLYCYSTNFLYLQRP